MMDRFKCARCGEKYPCTDEYWYKAKNKPSGLHLCWCKACHRANRVERFEANKEKERASNRLYQQTHRELVNARNREFYRKMASDPERRAQYNARMRDYLKKYHMFQETPEARERRLVRDRLYYETHKDELKAYAKAYQQTHKTELSSKAKEWRHRNPSKMRELSRRKYYRKTQPLVDAGLMKRVPRKPRGE